MRINAQSLRRFIGMARTMYMRQELSVYMRQELKAYICARAKRIYAPGAESIAKR